MPVFWTLSENIARIRAAEDLRMAMVIGATFSKESKQFFERLKEERGMVVDFEEAGFDKEGLENIKAMVMRANR